MIAVEKNGIVLKATDGEREAMAGAGRGEIRGGTLERIAAVLAEGEERTAFIREAVEREIKRRESARPIKRGHK